jgi:hypothetical protein
MIETKRTLKNNCEEFMGDIEKKLLSLGLVLPPPVKPPSGVMLPFQFIRLVGNRGYISGHGPQNPYGSIAAPFGKVGQELTVQQRYAAARLTALSILGSLKRALGDLDRVTHWCRVFGWACAQCRRHGRASLQYSR